MKNTFRYLPMVFINESQVCGLVGRVFANGLRDDFLIGLVVRVFANDPGDLGSISGRVIPNTLKMVLDRS